MNKGMDRNFQTPSQLNKFPVDWKVKPFWSITKKKSETNNEGLDLLSVYLYQGVVRFDDVNEKRTNVTSEDTSKYQKVERGNLVLNNQQAWRGSVGVSRFEGIVSPAYIVLELSKELETGYSNYLFRDQYMVDNYAMSSKGVGSIQQNIFFPILRTTPVPIPPFQEQKLISRYLDKKTSQIDSLVEKIQKKIDLLKEQRTSLINHYVTKGLDPNVEMKDSGIEWIGQIPRHWKTLRLCNFGLFSKGKNITKGDLVETGKPVILYSHLYTTYSRTVKEPKFFISDDLEENSTKIFKNTFLFTSSGESKEDIGKCILYLGNETSVGGDQVIFKLKSTCNFDPEFLSFSFNSDFCLNQKSSNSRGEIVVHIYEKQLRDVVVPIPQENEQIFIRNKLQEVERNSDEIIRNLKHKIELLKEYRQSLISSVVTGKVRVTEDMI